MLPMLSYSKKIPYNDIEVKNRLKYITQSLKKQQPGASMWWGGWIAIQSLGISYAVVAGALDPANGLWQAKTVTGVQATIGLIGLFIAPMETAYGYDTISAMADGNPYERYLKLKKAEEILEYSARRQRGGTSWIAHTSGVALGVTGGLLIWLAFKRPWWEGLINFFTMIVGAEARILTQPRRAINEWEKYQQRFSPQDVLKQSKDTNTSFNLIILPGFIYASLRF